jgi:hypothetical protein
MIWLLYDFVIISGSRTMSYEEKRMGTQALADVLGEAVLTARYQSIDPSAGNTRVGFAVIPLRSLARAVTPGLGDTEQPGHGQGCPVNVASL